MREMSGPVQAIALGLCVAAALRVIVPFYTKLGNKADADIQNPVELRRIVDATRRVAAADERIADAVEELVRLRRECRK